MSFVQRALRVNQRPLLSLRSTATGIKAYQRPFTACMPAHAPSSRASVARKTEMHAVARSGFDKTGASGLYDRARPSYPDEIVDQILLAPQNGARPLQVVELGPGTGISTRALLKRSGALHKQDPAQHGGTTRYQGFEPSEGMRSHFTRAVLNEFVPELQAEGSLPSVPKWLGSIRDGAFDAFADQATDANGQTGQNDLVLIAQAWHWSSDFDKALKEIAASLRPGGVLALLWNLEDREAARWVAKARDTFEQYEGGAPQCELFTSTCPSHALVLTPSSTDRQMKWKAMYDTPSIALFDALEPVSHPRVIPTTLSDVHDRIESKSYISTLDPDQLATVRKGIDAIFDEGDDKSQRKWIDKQKGIFEYVRNSSLRCSFREH